MIQRIRVSLAVAGLAAIAIAAASSQVSAGLRVPQVPVLGGTLQTYLNSQGETINVLTDQQDVQVWPLSASGTRLTLVAELSEDAAGNALGLYDPVGVVPNLYYLFPEFATPGWYAVLSFQTAPARLVISVFRANGEAVVESDQVSVAANNFGFYLSHFLTGKRHYSQDYRNFGGTGGVQMLAFQGTGGKWWLCFEDTYVSSPVASDRDYDDAVILMESVNPLPTKATSLGAVKALYR